VNYAFAALVFTPALAIGSFLNVVASRLPLGRSVSRPRSACPHCGAEIRPRDNVPVLSYLILRGRCRDCHASIGWRYPAVELTTAVLASVDARHTGSASGLNSAVARAGGLIATALLGTVLARTGEQLFGAFHQAAIVCAIACAAAGVAAFLLLSASRQHTDAAVR